MEEYEYSFKVSSIKPYIEYCEKNDYKKESEILENRKVYENKYNPNIIARITKTVIGLKEQIVFDCKNVKEERQDLKESQESIPLVFNQSDYSTIESILKTLEFKLVADNIRTRYVYKKNEIKFEIDDYKIPKAQVVAIEGNKEEVDQLYFKLKQIIK
ncbi:MAG: hypothetical protein ACI4U0_04480 [Candidatus Aphodocola sp.]